MAKVPYTNVVGCLMYAMVLTRPGIAYAINVVSRYMAQPERDHWKAVKWILRYLNGTMSCDLLYGKDKAKNDSLKKFVDSDYTRPLDRRRSLAGYVFTLNGCAVNWKETLQSVVAFSTTETEYTAGTEAIKEAIWLKS